MTLWFERPHIFRVILFLLVVLGTLATAVDVILKNEFWSQSAHLWGWSICVCVFATSVLFAGRLESGVWAAYPNFMSITVWLAFGLPAALLMIFTGSLIGIFLFGRKSILSKAALTTSPADAFLLYMARVIILCGGVFTAHLVYRVLNGNLPLTNIDGLPQILRLAAAQIASLLMTQILGWFLLPVTERVLLRSRLFWSSGQQGRMLQEFVLLLLAPVVAFFFYDSGIVVFSIVILVIGIQVVRDRQVYDTHQSLLKHVEQLSTLDTISRNLALNLNIEDVLTNIHHQVGKITDASTYYVALYDASLNTLEFPFVIEHGERTVWNSIETDRAPLTRYVVQHAAVYVGKDNRQSFAAIGYELHERYGAFVGFPLMVGDKVFGALCLASENADAFSEDVIGMLQTISHQAALTLRNAMLYNRSVEMSHNLARINNFVQGIVFNTDVKSVLQSASEVGIQIANADRIAIFYLDGENRREFSLSNAIHLLAPHRAWLEQHRYNFHAFNHTPVTYNDAARQSNDLIQLEAQIGEFQAKAEIPLRSGNTPVGLLVVYYNHPHYFRNAELELLETLAYQITAALDNAELVKALESYASEQAQLVHLSRVSTSTLDLGQVIETVRTLLHHMLDVQRVYIGLVERDTQVLRLYDEESQQEIALGVFKSILRTDTLPQLYGHEDVSPNLQQVLIANQDEAIAVASLIVNNDTIGMIALASARQFGEPEMRLLELATNQVSVQIHNALQYGFVQQALNRRLQQLSLIEDIARQISSALNVDQLIGNVLDAAIKATQADMAALALITETGDFQIIGQENIAGSWHTRQIKRSHTAGIMGRVAQTKEAVIIADNQQTPHYLSTLTQGRYQSSLVVPLLKDDTVIGVLNIESTQPNFFKEEHAEFIKSLGGHTVISIQNARLLQERQRQIEVLTSLRKLSLQLSSNVDQQAVVHEILQTALVVLQSEQAVMFSFSEDSSEPFVLGNLKRTETGYMNASITVPDAISRYAMETGETQVIQNVRNSSFYVGYPYINQVDYDTVIAAPIKHGTQVQEVLCITFARQRGDLEELLNILELLLIQAGGHLENSVLYERVIAGNDRLRAFLDSSSEGIILLDAQGNLVQANTSAEVLLGVDLSDYVGENFANRLLVNMEQDNSTTDAHEGLRNMARILRLEPERIIRRRFEFRRRGQLVFIEEVSSPVMDAQNRSMGRLLILRDVTEEKLLEDYRNEITNMIVHDLRSPLSAIYSGLSYSRFLIEDTADETITPVLDVALNSTTNLLTLVDSLLDIAKLETRSMPLKHTATSLHTLVEEAATMMTALIKEAEIELVVNVAPQLPPVYIDESKMKRVILNLLDNAQRFSPQGGKVLIEAVVVPDEQKVLMRIADSGKGIPMEERDRVFEKFRQVSTNSPARGRRGSGLGLTFCKLVLEAHGERIWVESQGVLPGASFAFTLPIFMEQQEE